MIESIKQTLLQAAIENPGIRSRYKMAAGIVHKKRLVCVGLNRNKTHTLMLNEGYREGQVFLHAEVDAIVKGIKTCGIERFPSCSLYVVRVKKLEPMGPYVEAIAKPCEGCMNLIQYFEFKEVLWTKDLT